LAHVPPKSTFTNCRLGAYSAALSQRVSVSKFRRDELLSSGSTPTFQSHTRAASVFNDKYNTGFFESLAYFLSRTLTTTKKAVLCF